MTREEIIEMFEMRLDGETLENIAGKYGVTKERVRQLLTPSQRAPKVFVCIYPGLKKWMMDNEYSCPRFINDSGLPVHINTFYSCITGKSTFNINVIKCILAFTGLTFEEAFGEEDIPGGDLNGCEQQAEGRAV